MNIQYYETYLSSIKMGLKKEAKQSLQSFVGSFNSKKDVECWTWNYLDELKIDDHLKIRHEIFKELIFPVLYDGYLANDFKSILWLGILNQNIGTVRQLDEQLGYASAYTLFMKCYQLRPNDPRLRQLLLRNLINGFEYAFHEWPAGVLVGKDGATPEECVEIQKDIEFALLLDERHDFQKYLKDCQKKITEYLQR